MNVVMRNKTGSFVKLALAVAMGAGACIWNVGGLNEAAAADSEVRVVAAADEHSMAKATFIHGGTTSVTCPPGPTCISDGK